MIDWKRPLKAFRGSQPFNFLATTTLRALFRALGRDSDLVVKHLHRFGTTQATLPNGRCLTLWSRGDDWVSNQVFWRGWSAYEPETVPLFFDLARRSAVVLDIGAHVGFYALLAGHANPAAHVFAFEPLPTIHGRLVRNIALNALPNAQAILSAVGDRSGTADFFHTTEGMPSSSSLSQPFMEGVAGLTASTVPVITIDEFLAARGLTGVGLVKIDTETTEPQVLAGMKETLRRDRPTLICEVLLGHDTGPDLEAILGPLGYHYYLLTPDGPQARTQIIGHPTWLNFLFAPAALG